MIDQVLQHHHPPAGEHVRDAVPGHPVQGAQCAAVHVEAGDLLGQRLADQVDRHVQRVEHVGEPFQPALGEQ